MYTLLPGTGLVVASDASGTVRSIARGYEDVYGDLVGVGDGTADDVQLQAAIDASLGSVICTEGTFNISAQVDNNATNINLIGQGPRMTHFKRAFNGNSVLAINAPSASNNLNMCLRGIHIDGVSGTYTGDGLTIVPNNTTDDIGYWPMSIENVLIDTVENDALVLVGGAVESLSVLTAINSWFSSSRYAINMSAGGAKTINQVTFNNCKATGGTHGIYASSGSSFIESVVWVGGTIGDGSSWGVELINCYGWRFIGVHFEGNDRCMSIDAGCHKIQVVGCRLDGDSTTASHFYIAGDECLVADCHHDGGGSGTLFEIAAGAADNEIRHTLKPDAPATFISDSGTRTKLHWNPGFVTQNSGASTGTGAQQTVAHGLAITPTRQQIALTAGSATAAPWHSADPDATNIYVTAANGQAWYWGTIGT